MSLLMIALALSTAVTAEGVSPSRHPEILQVACLTGSGTAFRIGPTTAVTAKHVIKNNDCFINGKPFKVVEADAVSDFALLELPTASKRWFEVDCAGFVKGRRYAAWGFARGRDTLAAVELMSEGDKYGAFARLSGVFTTVPGHSGGPMIDQLTKKVVGATYGHDLFGPNSAGIELKGTSLCRSA